MPPSPSHIYAKLLMPLCRSAALPRREKTAYRGVGCLVNLRLFEPNVDKNMII